MFLKPSQDTLGTFVVKFEIVLGMYANVVHVYLEPSLSKHVIEDLIHESLEGQWGVAEPKKHDEWFI